MLNLSIIPEPILIVFFQPQPLGRQDACPTDRLFLNQIGYYAKKQVFMNCYLGLDFGTSGARAMVIDAAAIVHFEAQFPFRSENNLPEVWQTGLITLISQIPLQIRRHIKAIAIDGTSSTVLLCNDSGNPISEPLLYNDGRGISELEKLRTIAPENHTVISATSSLAKLLWWQTQHGNLSKFCFLHQADWLGFLLHGKLGISDYHNALKLGVEPENCSYPNWLLNIQNLPTLPEVLTPGVPVGEVREEMCESLQLPLGCVVCAGTTDSIAAFLASGAKLAGEAVTSLGSTLVLKLLSNTRIDDSRFGIYSHRFPSLSNENLWLVGGASNTGGAVLRQFFTDEYLVKLSLKIDAKKSSNLDYYPLIKPGERFPINDAALQPRLTPHPENKVEFLHGLLESMAKIEARGYELLQELGATSLRRVYSAGGGAKNAAWGKIRSRYLGVEMCKPVSVEAAYGSALLAMRGVKN